MASSASSVNRQVVRVGSLKVRNTAGNEFCPPSPYPVDVGEDTKLFDLVSDYLTFDLNIARARALRDLIPVAQRSLPPTPANPLSRFLSGGRSRSPSPVREAESFRALIREHFDPHHSFSLACDVELACYSTEGGSVRLIVRATPSDRLPFHYGLRLFLVHRGQEIKLRLLHHRVPDRFRARRITSQYTDDPEWIEVWSPTDHGCRFSKGHEEWSQAGELELVDADCSNPEFDSVSDRDRFVNLLWDVSLQCATQNCGTSREHLLTKKAVEETPRLALAVKMMSGGISFAIDTPNAADAHVIAATDTVGSTLGLVDSDEYRNYHGIDRAAAPQTEGEEQPQTEVHYDLLVMVKEE